MSYTVDQNAINEALARIVTNENRMATAKQAYLTAQSDLAAMSTAYSSIVSDINTQATANPNDAAWQALKAMKDHVVSDFQADKTKVDAIVTAITNAGG